MDTFELKRVLKVKEDLHAHTVIAFKGFSQAPQNIQVVLLGVNLTYMLYHSYQHRMVTMLSITTVDMENLDTNLITTPGGSESNGSDGAGANNTYEDANTGAMGTNTTDTNFLFHTLQTWSLLIWLPDPKEEMSYDYQNWLWFHLESCRYGALMAHQTSLTTISLVPMETTGIEPWQMQCLDLREMLVEFPQVTPIGWE